MLGKQGKAFPDLFSITTLSRYGARMVSMRKENELVLVGGISKSNEVFASIKVHLKTKTLEYELFV